MDATGIVTDDTGTRRFAVDNHKRARQNASVKMTQRFEDALEAIGPALRALRLEKGLTQEQVAQAMQSVSGKGTISAVTKAETGAHVPGMETLFAMLLGLDVDLLRFAESHALHLAEIAARRDPLKEVMESFLRSAKQDPEARARLLEVLRGLPKEGRTELERLISELDNGNGDSTPAAGASAPK